MCSIGHDQSKTVGIVNKYLREVSDRRKCQEKHTWECWAPTPAAAPLGPLKTIGTDICPADM
jgi:hypothetical protein